MRKYARLNIKKAYAVAQFMRAGNVISMLRQPVPAADTALTRHSTL
jgi:hypothetical protein